MLGASDDETSLSTSSAEKSARALLAARGLRPKKRLGQHFLIDSGVARRIARLCVTDACDRVIEVGPGTGTLTLALTLLHAQLIAVEIDRDLVAVLRERAELADVRIV